MNELIITAEEFDKHAANFHPSTDQDVLWGWFLRDKGAPVQGYFYPYPDTDNYDWEYSADNLTGNKIYRWRKKDVHDND